MNKTDRRTYILHIGLHTGRQRWTQRSKQKGHKQTDTSIQIYICLKTYKCAAGLMAEYTVMNTWTDR